MNITGVVIFAIVLIATGTLYFLVSQKDANLADLDAQKITTQQKTESLKGYADLLSAQQRIVDIQSLLNGHNDWSNILPNLAITTLKGIYYTKLSVNSDGSGMLTGNADSFKELYRFIQGFTNGSFNTYIKSAELTNVSLGEHGGVIFTMNLTFDKSLWNLLNNSNSTLVPASSTLTPPSTNTPTNNSTLTPSPSTPSSQSSTNTNPTK